MSTILIGFVFTVIAMASVTIVAALIACTQIDAANLRKYPFSPDDKKDFEQ